jgi:hypothetical protein
MRDQDRAILKGLGVQVKEEDYEVKEDRPKLCPRCHRETPSNSLYCITCGLPMDVKTALEVDDKMQKAVQAILGSSVVPDTSKDLVKRFNSEFKDKIVEGVLAQIIEDTQMREKFVREMATRQQSSNQEAT